jgi:hypothetical protein
VLTVPDALAWHSWLTDHHDDTGGVWLVLAKKGTTEPTSLTYGLAIEVPGPVGANLFGPVEP